jgi:hypothetical protein
MKIGKKKDKKKGGGGVIRGKFKKYKVQCNHPNELVKKLDFRVATLVYVSL